MNIQLIQVPYDSGRRGERMGRGPLHFVERKTDDALRSNGWQVEVETVESQQPFLSEISTAFELARRLAERVQAARDAGAFPIVLAGNCMSGLGTTSGSYPEELGVIWFDAPHVPHGWDCGFLGELGTRTLLCSDLFTQAGAEHSPLTERDILGPSEAMRQRMDYFSHGKDTRRHLEKLAAFEPRVLACMHGSAYLGDGRALLLELADALEN